MEVCETCKDHTYTGNKGSKECVTCNGKVNQDRTECNFCNAGTDSKGNCKTNVVRPKLNCADIEIIVNEESVGVITFEPVGTGKLSESKCPKNGGFATYECSKSGSWVNLDISQCWSDKTEEFEKIILNEKTLEQLVEETKYYNAVAPRDICILADKLAKNYTDKGAGETLKNGMKVLSNLMATSLQIETPQETKNKVLEATETVVVAALENKAKKDSIIIKTDFTTIVVLQDVANTVDIDSIKKDVQLSIPSDSNIKNIGISIYQNSSLFSSDPENNKILGKVVGLKHTKQNNLNNKIHFVAIFPKKSVEMKEKVDGKKTATRECNWYNVEGNTWNNSGCTTHINNDGDIICNCDHMTSFAIILSVSPNKTVEWLSDLVLGINIFFCVLTLLCTLPFRTFRVRKMTVIQSHSIWVLLLLCMSWYLTSFNFGKDASRSTECQIVTFLIHYLIISYFSWTLCCTITLKSQILDAVKSFGKKNKNLVKNSCYFAYGFPLIPPTLSIILAWFLQNQTDGEFSYIRQTEECWYSDIWMYFLILFPVYIFLLINTFYFIKLLRVVGNARRGSDYSKLAKAFFALLFTQGLPWFIQPGALSGIASTVFQYLFLIAFGIQGFGIFICNVLCQEEVFKNLCRIMKVKPPRFLLSSPPKRHSPITGDTSMGTKHTDNKPYSNNLAINSIAETPSKSMFENTAYELYDTSLALDEKEHTYTTLGSKRSLNSSCKKIDEAFTTKEGTFKIKFVGNNRVYALDSEGSNTPSAPSSREASPVKCESEHHGPPFL